MRSEEGVTINGLTRADKIVNSAYQKIRKDALKDICNLHFSAYKNYIDEGATITEAMQLAGLVLAVLMNTDKSFKSDCD